MGKKEHNLLLACSFEMDCHLIPHTGI